MEKVERKNRVVINGQEIEVPEGYEVVVEGERIRVVPKEEKEPVKVVQAGEDIPDATVRTLKSVGLSFNEEKMRRNVSALSKVKYVGEGVGGIIGGSVLVVVGLLFLFLDSDPFGKFLLGIPFIVFGSFLVWKGIMILGPLFD